MPFFQDFDNNNKSDCIGFQVDKGFHYSMYSSRKVEAITILETEKSYVNILLGNYDVPEVSVDLAVTFQFHNIFSGFPAQVLSLQFCPVLPRTSLHKQAL